MRAVGKDIPRADAEAKVRGTAVYGFDVTLPGMVYARLLRSPVPAGRITRLDTERARATEGVLGVFTAADVPNHPTGIPLMDQRLFADGDVRYEGEPVAAVVATSMALADAAVSLIVLDIAAEAGVTEIEQAALPDSPLVHPDWETFRSATGTEWPRHGNIVCEMNFESDDIDEAFAAADEIVEETYRNGRQYQAYLESKMAVGEYVDGRHVVHVAHQFPFNVRARVAQVLGLEPEEVRVVGHHIGGGFGAKLDVALEPYAALFARLVERPVKLVNTRSEDLLTAPCRENAVVRIRSGVMADGTIVAREMDVIFDSGAFAIDAPYLASLPLYMAGAPYRVGSARVRCRSVYTNTAPTGAFRGVSGAYLVHAVERHTDHIANRLGMDRRQFRLQNLLDDGDVLLNGQELHDASILKEAFERVDEVAPWDEVGTKPYRGVGMAATVWMTNGSLGTAALRLLDDGRLALDTAATDNGSGAVTMGLRQIAAEELGLDADSVVVSMPDTDASGFDGGSQGSRTTAVVGHAIRKAGQQLRDQICKAAGDLLDSDADLEVVDGEVGVVGDPSSRIGLGRVAEHAAEAGIPIMAEGSYTIPSPSYTQGVATGFLFPSFATPTYHVHLAEVEVDPVTGRVHVTRYVVAQEVGKAINPTAVVGQIQGAVAQGLGYSLWERLDLKDGRYSQRTLESYGLPLAVDMPDVEVLMLEHPNPDGPFGAKGVAEPPIIPVAGAIANAVADAIGGEVFDLPISPEVVLRELHRMTSREGMDA